MSEEINNIDAEKKSKSQWKQEIQELKDALARGQTPGHEVRDRADDNAGFKDRI